MALGQLGVGFGRMGAVGGAGSSGADAVSALNAGFQSAYPLGTSGDYFVSKTGADTTGTSVANAFRTIAQATAVVTAGQTIRIIGDGAIYREAVTLTDKGGASSSAKTKLLGYGTDKPIISGADQVTSWTLCTSPTDDTELGATLAASGKIWKKTGIAIADFVGSKPISGNLYQSGQKMNIATAKAVRSINQDIDLFAPNWLVSPLTTTSGGNIVSYKLPADLQGKGFTSGQMTDVIVLQHVDGNVTFANTVSAFSSDTVTVTTAQAYASDAYLDSFALQNFLPEMRAGEWGYRLTGGGTTVTLYIWPHDASLGANMVIDVSKRGFGVKIGSGGCNASLNSNIEIAGLIFERQTSAEADPDANCAISLGGAPSGTYPNNHRTDINIHDCKIRDTWKSTRSYGQIWAQYTDNITVQRVTLEKTINSFGVFFQGEVWYDAQCTGLRFLDNRLEECTNSAVRLMGQKNAVIARNRFINFGIGDHSNQLNPYVISKDVVFYGNIAQGGSGYWTWGDSNPPDVLFNYIDSSHTKATASSYDAHGVQDQNNNDVAGLTQGMSKADWTTLNGGFINPKAPPCWYDNSPVVALLACNQVTPNALNSATSGGGIDVGTAVATYQTYFSYKLVNNVSDGILLTGDVWVSSCKSNLSTKGVGSITGVSAVDGSNVLGSKSSEYTDIATNDWGAPVGAVRRTKSGITTQSIASDIASLKSRFPDIASMFDYDAAGRTYDKTNPPVGPFTNVDDMPTYKPLPWTPPTLGGSPNSGSTSSVEVPIGAGYPKATIAYAWYLLADYRDYSSPGSVLGTSATSPTWGSGDIGKYPACKVTLTNSAGTREGWSIGTTAIGSGALISTPVELGTKSAYPAGSSTGASRTLNITSTGKPLVLIIGTWGISSGTYITWTVDVDGTPMVQKTTSGLIRLNTQCAVFFLTGVSAGAHTITMAPSSNYFGTVAQAMEINGAADLTPGTNVSVTATSASPTVTPAVSTGAVLHVATRAGGDIASNPVTMSTGEAMVFTAAGQSGQVNSGTAVFSDVVFIASFEQAPSTSPRGATFQTGGAVASRQFVAVSLSVTP